MFFKNNYEKTLKKAEKCLKKKDFIKAKENYIKCLSIRTNDIIVLNNLAQLYNILGDKRKSDGYNEILINECNKKLKTDKNKNILTLKINALTSLKRFEELKYTIDELLTLDPEDLYGLYQKSQILEKNKKHKKALNYLNKILDKHPQHISTLLAKGRNHVELNEFDKAEECYNYVLMIETKNKAAINLKSEMLKKKNNITLTPHDFMLKAIESFEREDFKSSLDFYQKALKMNPEYDEIWFAQGELLIRVGFIEAAIASFKNAFLINPKSGGIEKHDEFFKMLNRMKKINKLLGFKNP